MDILMNLFTKLWENTEKGDAARLATQKKPDGIAEINNIAYIDDGNRYHLMDMYYPENAEGKLPVIIDIHGGGWMYADKELNKIFCLNMAKRGFAVFNISYRLVPEVSVNEQLMDCAAALKWISENGGNYPVCDMENVMLAGDSAGGQLSFYSALLMSSPELRRIFGTPEYSLNIKALTAISPVAYMNDGWISIYGRKMWGKDYRKKATYHYMNLDSMLAVGKLPPTFLVTSSGDFLALKQTRRAAEEIRNCTSDVCLMDMPRFEGEDLPHVFCVLEPESKAGNMIIDKFTEFFLEHTETKLNK